MIQNSKKCGQFFAFLWRKRPPIYMILASITSSEHVIRRRAAGSDVRDTPDVIFCRLYKMYKTFEAIHPAIFHTLKDLKPHVKLGNINPPKLIT